MASDTSELTVISPESEPDCAYFIQSFVFPAAFALLPGMMDSPEARAMLLAIGFQESKFLHRYQVLDGGVRGPARGFWQFEQGGGVAGVLTHPYTERHIRSALADLNYMPESGAHACYTAIEHNDVLACVFSRLNLWWLPGRLATRDLPQRGWRQYIDAWRPGKPHPETWNDNFARAWAMVQP
jgi:hypothetical protein